MCGVAGTSAQPPDWQPPLTYSPAHPHSPDTPDKILTFSPLTATVVDRSGSGGGRQTHVRLLIIHPDEGVSLSLSLFFHRSCPTGAPSSTSSSSPKGLVPYSSRASGNFYCHGVALNSSSAICIPARDKPNEVDTFFNAWLEVLPDIQTICLLCMSERDPRPTCLRRAEAMDLGGCMFGTTCALPDDLTSAPAFDAFAMRDLSVCGYYEPTNAAVISLYLCFSLPPTTPPTTTTPEILLYPSLRPGPAGGLVLREEGEVLYDNVRHEVVPVLVHISGIRVPEYCTAQVRSHDGNRGDREGDRCHGGNPLSNRHTQHTMTQTGHYQ
ncbi:hypothetical protein chiPu_0024096 [Chiloscyllium punctatum]|uniref:Uncharacterized protein n=1 Tax=Chiloscyllium punctatum TaxID=137246 RepID=A0A401TBZ3_CHIPU|nr:hypothetical protein [Chiloscyllium punctatum]